MRFAYATILISFAALSPAAPEPKHLMKEPVYFHPTKVGTKWVYCHGKDTVATKTVIESRRRDGGRVVTIESDFGNQTKVKSQYYVTGTAIFLVASGDARYSPPSPLFHTTRGDSWTWSSKVQYGDGGGPMLNRHCTVRSSGVLEVAAGSFEATRIDSKNVEDGAGGLVHSSWYAEGIGEVKFGMPDFGHFIELKSFTPGRE